MHSAFAGSVIQHFLHHSTFRFAQGLVQNSCRQDRASIRPQRTADCWIFSFCDASANAHKLIPVFFLIDSVVTLNKTENSDISLSSTKKYKDRKNNKKTYIISCTSLRSSFVSQRVRWAIKFRGLCLPHNEGKTGPPNGGGALKRT